MAEARSAVCLEGLEPSLKRTSTHDQIMITQEMIKTSIFPKVSGRTSVEKVQNAVLVTYSGVRTLMYNVRGYFYDLLFPSSELSLATSLLTAVAAHKLAPEFMKKVSDRIPFVDLVPEGIPRHAFTVCVTGTSIWLSGVVLSRQTLALLLRYKGYMYDPPKKVSLKTKLFLAAVRLVQLGIGAPRTYSFQPVIPRLPLPSLKDTCTRYLACAKPLLDEVEYARMERLANDFVNGEGVVLQRFLWLKSLWSTNYVTDWWERFVYLRGRESIMINSNYYICDAYTWTPTKQPVARMANLIYNILQYKKLLDREQVTPTRMHGAIPLCMAQYVRTFGTTRIPGEVEDTIAHVNNSRHVAVMCGGHFYIVTVIDELGRILLPLDLEKIFTQIQEDAQISEPPTDAERYLATMTAQDRTTWARFRNTHMAAGVTRASLEAIERALFVAVFDDAEPNHPKDSVSEQDDVARNLLHGNGSNRWFDKSFTLVVFKNGKMGMNCEHSWADAPVAAHMCEHAMGLEFQSAGYDDQSGMNKAIPRAYTATIKPFLKLRWGFSPEAEAIILESLKVALAAIDDLNLRVVKHDAYSRGFITKSKMSPDGYIQMALQLAYYRDAGKFTQTYESSMTRLFREGRTETVRPVTLESVDFVRAMEDPSVSDKTRVELLRAAIEKHVTKYRDAMCGKGIDRHLFCLYVTSVGRGITSPFLKEVLSVPWNLSTSQTPVQQTLLWDRRNNPNKVPGGGGFGPVSQDGYGVSYIIADECNIFFHITSKKKSVADAGRFAKRVVEALKDMRRVVTNAAKE